MCCSRPQGFKTLGRPFVTELVYQTSKKQISIMRSRVRYADPSWNEGKTPILLFVIQILVSLSIGYLCSLVDPPTRSFQMFLTNRAIIHVNVFLLKRLINLEGFVKKHILPSYDCGISLMCTDVVLIFDLPLCYDLAWGAGNLLHIVWNTC